MINSNISLLFIIIILYLFGDTVKYCIFASVASRAATDT
nr:MAG TPA: hypothetical protein [Caudoviricetes sp.]